MTTETIHGLEDLLKSMDALPLTLQKKLIARALRTGAEPIRARAQELAPDDPGTPQSHIKEAMSITVSDQTADGAIAKIGPKRKAFDARFHELGTAHEPARPFLTPAFEEKRDEALVLISETLADGIEREMTKR